VIAHLRREEVPKGFKLEEKQTNEQPSLPRHRLSRRPRNPHRIPQLVTKYPHISLLDAFLRLPYSRSMSSEGNIVIDDAAVDRRMREKADRRRRDAERLTNGEVTPKELQRENSMFTAEWIRSVKIADYFCNVGVS